MNTFLSFFASCVLIHILHAHRLPGTNTQAPAGYFFFLPFPFFPPFFPFFFLSLPPASTAGQGVGLRASNLTEKSSRRWRMRDRFRNTDDVRGCVRPYSVSVFGMCGQCLAEPKVTHTHTHTRTHARTHTHRKRRRPWPSGNSPPPLSRD